MSRADCLMALLACAQMHNKQLPEFIITLYKKAIDEINDDVKVLKALERFANSNKFPSVNELKEACGIGEVDESVWASSQALLAFTAIGDHGRDGVEDAKRKLDPTTYNAISNYFGSWYKFCMDSDDADRNSFIAQFRETLKAYKQQVKYGDREDKPRLPGGTPNILESAKDIVNQLLPEQVRQQLQLTSPQENASVVNPGCLHKVIGSSKDGIVRCLKCKEEVSVPLPQVQPE